MSSKKYKYVIETSVSKQQASEGIRQESSASHPEVSVTLTEEPSLEDVLEKIFGIGRRERELYFALIDRGTLTVRKLAGEMGWHRSSVSRGLKCLLKKGLVTRRRRILDSGGQVYEYTARSPDVVHQLLRAGLEKWTDTAEESLEEFKSKT